MSLAPLFLASLLVLDAGPIDDHGREGRTEAARRAFLGGLDAFAAGDLDRAVAEWKGSLKAVQEALAVSPTSDKPTRSREILLTARDSLFRDLPTPWGIHVAVGAGRLDLGEYEAAEDEFRQAWESAETFSDEGGRADAELGLSLASLYRGDLEAARRYALAALVAYDRLEDGPAAMDALTALGAAEFHRGDLGKAAQAFAKAESLARDLGLSLAQVRLLNNQGEILKALGDVSRAIEVHRRAMELAKTQGFSDLEWAVAVNLSEDLLLSGELARADLLGRDRISPYLPEVRDPDQRWRAFHVLAQVKEGQGRVDEALGLYRKAIEEVESIRTRLRRPVYKIRYQDDKYRVFDRAAHLAWRSGLTADCFAFLERARGRALMDVLFSEKSGVGTASPLPEAARVKRLTAQATHLEGMVDRLVVGALRSGPTRMRHAPHAAGDPGAGPGASPAALTPGAVATLDDLHALLPGRSALVGFAPLAGSWVAFVVTPSGWQVTDLGVSVRRVDGLVARFRAEVLDPVMRRPPRVDREVFQPVLRELYDALIAPLEDQVAGFEHLAIVPDGPLFYVPFGALLTRDGFYLIERHSISYLPSASSLGLFLGRESQPIRSVVAVGNPTTGLEDLPRAENEARRVAGLFPGSLLLLGPQATKTRVVVEAGRADALLISAHADLTPAEPLSGSIFLAADGGGTAPLTVAELFDLRLRARVAVLSGCRTGLVAGLKGRRASGIGEEMIGLARGFLHAGAPAVVGSLWQVEDTSTAFLVERFFSHAKSGQSLAESLRRAQLELMRQARNVTLGRRFSCAGQVDAEEGLDRLMSHPFFWGGFVLMGDWR